MGSAIAAAAPDDRIRWGLLGSLILHALVWLAFLLPAARRPLAPFEEGVPVEVWSTDEFQAVTEPKVPALAPAEPTEGTGLALPAVPPLALGTLIRAKTILSSDVLDHPLSRKARAMLPFLEKETRLEQLCGIEAMAQIAEWHRQFQPDRVVAYALADLKVTNHRIVAEGAAFRSQQRWHRLRFTCEIVPGRDEVRAFEFMVGEPIPKSAWDRYGLPPVH